DEFKPELDDFPEEVQDELLAKTRLLEQFGPRLGRPTVDTLNGSKYANMKELRLRRRMVFGGQHLPLTPNAKRYCSWPETNQVGSESRFYHDLIAKADRRFGTHLQRLEMKKRK